MKKARIIEIDAARGAAMFFVFISHFGFIYFKGNNELSLWTLFAGIGMVASPTFMIISGTMLGYLFQLKKNNFEKIKNKLIDRGLFLILTGHVLITISHIFIAGGLHNALRWGFITDVIGISIIFGPLLISKIKPKLRVILFSSILFMNWVLVYLWNPDNYFLRFIKETFIGTFKSELLIYEYIFPIIPWFSLYFISSCIGEKIGRLFLLNNESKIPLIFIRLGLSSVLLAIILFFPFFSSLDNYLNVSSKTAIVNVLTSPFQKLPPSPAYFFLYGGIGLIMTFILFRLNDWKFSSKVVYWMSIVGKTSLFVFIIQYYMYFTFLHLLDLNYSICWPIYFVISIMIIYFSSQIWHMKGFNKFITMKLFLFKKPKSYPKVTT